MLTILFISAAMGLAMILADISITTRDYRRDLKEWDRLHGAAAARAYGGCGYTAERATYRVER